MLALCLAGCGPSAEQALDEHASHYVALALHSLDSSEIDGYFGPEALADTALPPSSVPVRQRVQALAAQLRRAQAAAPSPRRARLLARTEHLDALLGVIAAPRPLDFDSEASLLLGMAPVAIDQAGQVAARQSLAALLPGPGTLAGRVQAYRARFMLAPSQRQPVFMRALAECRARTALHWPLPPNEQIKIIWTSAVPAAWHRYLGQSQSRLQINPAAVADPAAALDLACHEAYPGHHAQFLLQDAHSGGMAIEDTLVLLRSPQSALREGAANHGINMAFPPAARAAFMAEALFPMAGFSPAEAKRHARVHQLIGQLALSVIPILRRYRNGDVSREQTLAALASDALLSSPDALLGFFDQHGTLVLGYTAAPERVRAHVDARADKWAALAALMVTVDTTPLTSPSGGDGKTAHAGGPGGTRTPNLAVMSGQL